MSSSIIAFLPTLPLGLNSLCSFTKVADNVVLIYKSSWKCIKRLLCWATPYAFFKTWATTYVTWPVQTISWIYFAGLIAIGGIAWFCTDFWHQMLVKREQNFFATYTQVLLFILLLFRGLNSIYSFLWLGYYAWHGAPCCWNQIPWRVWRETKETYGGN